MNTKLIKPFFMMGLFLCLMGGLSVAAIVLNKATDSIPVSWDTGFIMPALLASPVELHNLEDLQQLIAAPWYAELKVSQTKVGESVFSSCRDYFERVDDATRTTAASEMNAYLEFKVMCEAIRLLMTAENSESSYLPDPILSDAASKQWPKALALQISVEESRRSAEDPELKYWSDITPITRYESQSTAKASYYHESGYQEVEIVGRGDTNSDGVEDVLLVMRDHVYGGNYFNIRLLVLSVDAQRRWHLLTEF
ncbi:hypothetical protein [Shewanella salipaludis]|uniref:Uncharacterized protein n=1 Tax=Shewanella salipaludis TaxID=2723052 RepID=A0A972FU78_9GAMM|nr:hypothetical protein [Shewanella salipaludis]NMH66250.1 hypothetical protein [Shewanella salipaludis]